jgi:hypothetical protein
MLKKPSVLLALGDEPGALSLLLFPKVGVRSFQAATIFLTELKAEGPGFFEDEPEVGGGERKVGPDFVGEVGLEPVADPSNCDSGGMDGRVLVRVCVVDGA